MAAAAAAAMEMLVYQRQWKGEWSEWILCWR